jgi:hypothetical protein
VDDLMRHARTMQERVLLMLVGQRVGWTDNTHMASLLKDVKDGNTDREVAFAIEWLKMLPMKS